MTRCINLFGGPGIGKSTFAAGLFAELKRRHLNVEIVTEYAKDLIWEGRPHMLSNQISVLGGQWDRVSRLVGKVDLIVTDSPVLLCSIYAPADHPPEFHELAWWCHRKIEGLNLVLTRHSGDYQAAGRIQDEHTAAAIDRKIVGVLESRGERYHRVSPDTGALPSVLRLLEQTGIIETRPAAA